MKKMAQIQPKKEPQYVLKDLAVHLLIICCCKKCPDKYCHYRTCDYFKTAMESKDEKDLFIMNG